MRQKLVQVKVRIPSALKRKLDKEAKKRTDGSLSGAIVTRLELSETLIDLLAVRTKQVLVDLEGKNSRETTQSDQGLRDEKDAYSLG